MTYGELHAVRSAVSEANGALAKYAGDSSRARRGALYALAGYAEVMLADFFCSGVPLSTWDFERDFTYDTSRTTDEVYTHATALFDTAMQLAADSVPIVQLARIGKGRALLALGQFGAAAMAVQDVPSDFRYTERLFTCGSPSSAACESINVLDLRTVTVSSYEGGTKVISWTNPRTAGVDRGATVYGFPVYFPVQYEYDGVSTVTLASGVEADLIRAEAALRAGDITGWLAILNGLRASSPLTDTMAAITDPGPATRPDTMFAERAQWLFLSGHRQGDLRRLIRQYPPRTQQTVYPRGVYPGGINGYGSEVTALFDVRELPNPRFVSCFDRRA
jgi:hypothetical protein